MAPSLRVACSLGTAFFRLGADGFGGAASGFLAQEHVALDSEASRSAPAVTVVEEDLVNQYFRDYHFMPEEKVIICSCAKCGSTSMYEFVYREAMHRDWNYTGPPYVQDVSSERWSGKFQSLKLDEAREIMARNDTFSFALVRDPVQRLISSWKSKAACDGGPWGTDLQDRARIVPKLLALANQPSFDCLSFDKFIEAIATVHTMGKANELNSHFLPQQYDCFRDFPPSSWSRVATVKDSESVAELAKHFGDFSKPGIPQFHSSPKTEELLVSDQAKVLLREITAPEYEALNLKPAELL